MNIKLSKKLTHARKSQQSKSVKSSRLVHDIGSMAAKQENGIEPQYNYKWNYLYPFIILFAVLGVLVVSLANLQITQGNSLYTRSMNNSLQIRTVYPVRGIIMDRNGNALSENVPSYKVYISVDLYMDDNGDIDNAKVRNAGDYLQNILGDDWRKYTLKTGEEYSSFADKLVDKIKQYSYMSSLLIAEGIDNDAAISIKSHKDNIPGVYVDMSTRRNYIDPEAFSNIVGYTSKAYAEDLERLDYIDPNDIIGRTGIEYSYDKYLIGTKGQVGIEVDAFLNQVSDTSIELKSAENGSNVYLTIDKDMQKTAYSILADGVVKNNASGGAIIVEDVSNGEIVAMATYPSYDSNLFAQGISEEDYKKLSEDPHYPLTNRPISSVQPPGSIFKTIVGASALDAGIIDRYTRYQSRWDYSFSNGASFWEYNRASYGWINLTQALEVSSNIFFCEVIRNWEMEKLVPYLEKFGIGSVTGVDIPGEATGTLPSPENKIVLAKTTNPWLDPIWYPEGDSCNSVIGQGITLVSPVQAVNWVSAIANGGKLNTPHLGKKIVDADGLETVLNFEPIRENIVSDDALQVIREGMHETIYGPRKFIYALNGAKYSAGAKTGTAEFGRVNANGDYEHTHAWVVGFFPYEHPKYAFVVFLEDGGKGTGATWLARSLIDSTNL